jgi:CHAT domain-containing protein
VNDSGPAGQDDVIQRLRELYEGADDEDRPRAALHLGLALADKAAGLAADDPGRDDLTREGLDRLAESGDASAAVAATERLERCRPVPAPAEPASFPLLGGDLNWDLDWDVLRGPAEMSRNLATMLPLLAAMLPPHEASLRDALTSIKEVLDAFERGHWTPEGDAVLSAAIEQVDASEMGTGTGLMLRVTALMIRTQRCQHVLKEGGQPDWPPLAELDRLIAALESDSELGVALGPPFGAVEGLQHLFIVFVVAMRIQVSMRAPGMRHDAAWRDDTLRLLGQADDHLRQTPPSHAGLLQPLRGRLAEMAAALRGAVLPPGPRTAPSASRPPATPKPAFPPTPATPPRPASPPTVPSAPTAPSGPAAADQPPSAAAPSAAAPPSGAMPWWSGPLVNQISPQMLAGLKVMADQMGGPTSIMLSAMLLANEAVSARRWDPAYDARLAELDAQADRLAADDLPLQVRAMIAAALAVTHASRSLQLTASPRPDKHPSADDFAAVLADLDSALELMDAAGGDQPGTPNEMSSILHAQAAIVLVEISRLDVPRRAELLARARGHFDQVPAGMREHLPVLDHMKVLAQLMAEEISPDDPAVDEIADVIPNTWDREGLGLKSALLTVEKARKSRVPEDVAIALRELQLVWAGLSAGNPKRAQVLISMATMQSVLTAQGHRLGVDATSLAIAAVRTATGPGELAGAAHILVTTFTLMLSRGERAGPFQEAAEALRPALAGVRPDDWALRTTLLTAAGAAAALAAADDEGARAASRPAIREAEQTLPDPQPTEIWYATARLMSTWAAVQGLCLGDDESVRLALRLTGTLQTLLSSHPEVAPAADTELEGLDQLRQQLTAAREGRARGEGPGGQPPEPDGEKLGLARGRLAQAAGLLGIDQHGVRSRRASSPAGPDLDALRACAADLHAALAAAAADTRLRHDLDRMLGICHAEFYGHGPAGEADQGLREAVIHLYRALATADHARPTVEWADTLDVLAQCLREASQREDDPQMAAAAERVARAALRELADCVLVADDTGQAVEVAAHASEIVARAIGWCLADGRYRTAVDLAETGRGLVLASGVLSGRGEEILRGAGLDDAADAWWRGSGADRAAALNALRDTTAGHALLSTPIGEETAATLAGTTFDAVVYLVPPTAPDAPGVTPASATGRTGLALVIRQVRGQVDVVELPELTGLGPGSPLDGYLAALDRALAEPGPGAGGAGGFRAGPAGQAWASALDEVGRWAYASIMGPLLDHVRGWELGHLPHLALIPLGGLAAIPYAAAWTDATPDGERRYAIDDAVLSYAASARLLGETARRPRRPLSDRVVLVTNPDGELPMTRLVTGLLASRQYKDAEVYGAGGEASGAATIERLLGALPAEKRPGASLLQLSTHGRTEPEPGLKAKDGWLTLARILNQARDRAADAPGGLVITNACLTDTTRTHHDESLTLATAFLAGGATAVIGTRWPVDDDTTAVMSFQLHYYLQLGRPPAEALRQAQLDLLRPSPGMRATLPPALAAVTDERLSHAASWAGHVHHGV